MSGDRGRCSLGSRSYNDGGFCLAVAICILLLTGGCVEGNLIVNLGLSGEDGTLAGSPPDADTSDAAGHDQEEQPDKSICYLSLSPAAKAELDSMGYSKTKHPNLYSFLLSSGRLRSSLPPCPAE